LQALAAARADPTATTAQTSTTLNSIAAEPSAGRSRVVVLLTRCDAGRATGFPSLVSRLANGRQQLDVVETGSSCAPALAAQARSTGGIAMSSVSDARLAEAMDSLTADLLGQYRLSVRNGQRSAPLDVQMDYAGVQASTTVGPRPGADSRSAAATASPPVIRAATPAASAAGSGGVKVLAGLSALVLLATAAGYVLALRRRTPPLAA
jgi:hypothetical protein